ncbi:MAG: response regulator transcription factor [Acidimicrobiales bacterium]
MGSQPPRVLLIEDDDAIRCAVAQALESQGYQVQASADCCDVEGSYRSFRPDLAVLDVNLPVGPDGYAIARRLRAEADVSVLFLTAADDLDARLAGFEVGADDYISKPFAMAELLARIRAVLRRAGRGTSAVSEVADLVVDDGNRQAIRGGSVLELTPTEFDLLSAMVHRQGRVVSKTELLTQVWGFDAYDDNLVEVHMSSLRSKLEAKGRRLIHTLRGAGYELRP